MARRLLLVATFGLIFNCAQSPVAAQSAPAPQQDLRTAADQAYAQAMQLYTQKTPESIRGAAAKGEEALALYRQLGDRAKEAELLVGLGNAYLVLGDKARAAESLRQGLEVVRGLGRRSDEAVVLNMLAGAYETSQQATQSQDTYQQALALCRELNDPRCQGSALMGLGRVAFATREQEKALGYFDQALPLWRTLGDRFNQASAANMVALLHGLSNRKQASIPYYLEALPLFHDLGQRALEARTLYNLGEAYAAAGNQVEALRYFDQAIPALHATADEAEEATALTDRGLLHEERGEMRQAVADLTAAQTLFHVLHDSLMEATVVLRLGIVSYEQGENEKALGFYQQALQLARTSGDPAMQAAALTGVSSIYGTLGDDSSALKYCEEASRLMPADAGSQADPDVLYRLGVNFTSLKQNEKAMEWFSRAARLQRARGDRPGEARALQALAGMYDIGGRPEEALTLYQQALEIRQTVGDRRSRAQSLTAVGTMYAELAQPARALVYYRQALEIYQAVHDRVGESLPLFWMAKSEQAMGDLEAARGHIEASLAITESQRSAITSQELRTSYLAKAQYAYEFYVDVLMQLHKSHPGQGYDAKALEAHERARARGLLDLLSEAKVDFRQGVDPGLLQREIEVRRRLEDKQSAEIRLLADGDDGEQARQIQKDLEGLRAEYQQVESQIRGSSPRYAALTQPQPLGAAAIQKEVLDGDTLLLEYALGSGHSYLWAVTPAGLTSFELPARGEIEKLAVRLYRTITGRLPSADDDYQKTAAALSRMVLGPVQNRLGSKRLLIAADGALQVVPFAALPSPAWEPGGSAPYEPLVVAHEIVYIPSASTLALLRRDVTGRHPASKRLAVFADPVFEREDDRVAADRSRQTVAETSAVVSPQSAVSDSRGVGDLSTASLRGVGLERLLYSRKEAEVILPLAPPQSRFAALDFAANRSAALSPELGQYRIVHFATHGIVNDAHPELSGIVLSLVDKNGGVQDGFLRLNDLFNLKLNADLVVLSACKTGLGKEVRGEGLIGLARGFMYAGTPRVVVSLWSINDQAASEEMRRFYAGMLGDRHLPPAAALRQAQIEMWKQDAWRDPFLWAAFVLQGDWR